MVKNPDSVYRPNTRKGGLVAVESLEWGYPTQSNHDWRMVAYW